MSEIVVFFIAGSQESFSPPFRFLDFNLDLSKKTLTLERKTKRFLSKSMICYIYDNTLIGIYIEEQQYQANIYMYIYMKEQYYQAYIYIYIDIYISIYAGISYKSYLSICE